MIFKATQQWPVMLPYILLIPSVLQKCYANYVNWFKTEFSLMWTLALVPTLLFWVTQDLLNTIASII